MRPMRCAPLLTVTTRASSRPAIRSSSRPVSAKWARWLVPNWSSNPSLVSCRGWAAMTPALLMSRSRPSCALANHSANPRTEARLPRSSEPTSISALGTPAWIARAASAPFSALRTARTTRAPARASSRAAKKPMPLLAPVTTATRPCWLEISAAVHLSAMARLCSLSALRDMEGHPGKAFGHSPQLSSDLLVVGGLTRAGAGLRVATRLEEAAWADVGATFKPGIGRGVKNGQCAHLGALGEEAAAADPPEETVEPGRRGGGLDVGRGVAGVGGQAADRRTGGAQTAVQLEGEEQGRQLRLSVGAPAAVAALALEVVEVDPPDAVKGAAYGHDARVLSRLHAGQKQPRQCEVPEVIRPERHLEAVRRLPPGREPHGAG